MDAFSLSNSGMSHDLVAEITVYGEDQEELTSVALDWLTRGVAEAISVGGVGNPPKGLPVSDVGFNSIAKAVNARKGGWWGCFSASPRDTFDVLYNPYVSESIHWVDRAIRARPESMAVKIGEFMEGGEIGNSAIRFSVSFDEDLASYVKLTYFIDEALLSASSTTQIEHTRLLASVSWACRRYNVVFSHFSYAHTGGATELERYFRGPSGIPSRNTPQWRDRLRGYSWLMVASREIVHDIGGVGALRESNAFQAVSPLPNGSVLLQATPSFQEYRGERVGAVHRVLRDALIQGEFRRPAPVPGQPPTHMVIFDS
ncbi:hypothetical protein ACIGW4_37760 [Streptomyces sp. NPDC053513]|uniref:hypothetical protein n=1 Tax=unclassified Streptomyces TaxID=2593676 RepID=UPI0037D43EA3